MADYCTTDQLALVYPAVENHGDYAGDDGSADTNVKEFWISSATQLMWSVLSTLSDGSNYDPSSYVAGTYPMLDYLCAWLAADFGKASRGMKPVPGPEHPVMHQLQRVVDGFASINAA
jgi:hypothetical protein